MKRKKGSPPSRRLRGRAKEAYELWEDRLEEISSEFTRRADDKSVDPYDRKSSFLLREIYRLVNDLKASHGDKLEDALAEKLARAPKIPFHQAPYLWALKAANGDEGIDISTDKVLRYGLALNYAKKHSVPPHFLCGFLHQVGGIRSIDRKSVMKQTEEWLIIGEPQADEDA